MASAAVQTHLTPEEYLAWERKAATKHEYHNGQIVAMSGASYAHTLIAANIVAEIHAQLKGKACTVHASDMRVKTPSTVSYFYPDVVVVCDEPGFEDNTFDVLLNPVLIVEVLSASTAAYDRGEKFEHYKQLISLQEYILVSQDRVCIEHYHRLGAQWIFAEFYSLADVFPLPSVECELSLRDIYARVKFRKNPL